MGPGAAGGFASLGSAQHGGQCAPHMSRPLPGLPIRTGAQGPWAPSSPGSEPPSEGPLGLFQTHHHLCPPSSSLPGARGGHQEWSSSRGLHSKRLRSWDFRGPGGELARAAVCSLVAFRALSPRQEALAAPGRGGGSGRRWVAQRGHPAGRAGLSDRRPGCTVAC